MRFLAEYVMRGRMQAIVVSAVTALLSLLMLPMAYPGGAAVLLSLLLLPMAYLSGATVGLVTLRVNPAQGLGVIAGAMLALAVLCGLMLGNPFPGFGFAMVLWLPVWVLAANLRRSVNLAQSVRLAGLFGVMLVVGIYLATDNPVNWWQEGLQKAMSPALDGAAKESIEEMSKAVAQIARLMTGFMGGLMGLNLLISLFIARSWQARLYNPGGFRQEFHRLSLGRRFSLAASLVGMVLLVSGSHSLLMATDLLVVMVMLFMVQGLAVSHSLVANSGARRGWLVVLYLLLVLALPQTALTLALAGFADNWFDFRAFFGNKLKQ